MCQKQTTHRLRKPNWVPLFQTRSHSIQDQLAQRCTVGQALLVPESVAEAAVVFLRRHHIHGKRLGHTYANENRNHIGTNYDFHHLVGT